MSELDALRYLRLSDLVQSGGLVLSYENISLAHHFPDEHFMDDKEEMDAYLDAMGKYE